MYTEFPIIIYIVFAYRPKWGVFCLFASTIAQLEEHISGYEANNMHLTKTPTPLS